MPTTIQYIIGKGIMKRMKDMGIMEALRAMATMRLMGLIGLIAVMGLTSCSSDEENFQQKGTPQTLTLITSSSSFVEVNPMATTRALPTGYKPYNELYPTTVPEHTKIGVFMTPERTDAMADFVYMGYEDHDNDPSTPSVPTNKWMSSIVITDQQQYYMYGFMPREDARNAEITPLNSDYANGATLTIRGLNSVTGADVCVIVGVKKWAPTNPGDTPPIIENSGIQLGEFGYEGGPTGSNYVYLLIKHLFAGLHFKAHVDPTYDALRTIRVKKFELISDVVSDAIDLTIELTSNTAGTDPVTSISYAPAAGASTTATTTLFPYEGSPADVVIPVASPEDFLACYAPSICNSFILQTTFDVYDKNGNKTRENCVVQNQINNNLIPQINTMTAGQIYTIDLLIKPTYLYVMSDPDLDNPTIIIN